MPPLPILIPAAGLSRRLGRPKQLEVLNTTTLLRQSAQRALASNLGPVHILLGHAAQLCLAELTDLNVTTYLIPNYQEGLAATLRHGITALSHHPALLITLVDQHQLTPTDLIALSQAWQQSNLPLAAAKYADNSLGPPAIFTQPFYPQLLQLTGDGGAKKILRANPTQVATLSLPNAEPDYD